MNRQPLWPVSRRHGIAFVVPQDWTPQQAPVVFELPDELRKLICSCYLQDIQHAMHDGRWHPELIFTDPPSF